MLIKVYAYAPFFTSPINGNACHSLVPRFLSDCLFFDYLRPLVLLIFIYLILLRRPSVDQRLLILILSILLRRLYVDINGYRVIIIKLYSHSVMINPPLFRKPLISSPPGLHSLRRRRRSQSIRDQMTYNGFYQQSWYRRTRYNQIMPDGNGGHHATETSS
ncbi:MAG: hypothetical protein A4E45_01046 [Methanosaeta sp. PtaB.Bin039]|nr:MAG: hypothetical protein A4E45_01046 [Methanosaeta sp. PtaB.Bin039]